MKRIILCTALALVLAPLAGFDAARAYWRGASAGPAPRVMAGDPVLRLRASEKLLASPDAWSQAAPMVREAGRAALRAAPLNAAALRQIGLADNPLGAGTDLRPIELAERVSRRDLPTELLLIFARVRQGRTADSLSHYDHALSVYGESESRLFPVLASQLGDPQVRWWLAAYAGKPWLQTFAVRAAEFGAKPEPLAALLGELGDRLPLATRQDGIIALVRQNFAGSQSGVLAPIVARIPGVPVGTFRQIGVSPASTDPRFAPLSWKLPSDAVVQTEAEADRLTIRIAPEHSAIAASRMTLFEPGSYVFSQSVGWEAGAPHARLTWQVSCQGGTGAVIGQMAIPTDGSAPLPARLTVPSDCPVQNWQLFAEAAPSQFTSSAQVSALALERQ